MIQTGVEGMLSLTDPYTEYYPEEEVSSLKEMTTGKYGGIGAAIRYYEAKDRIVVVEPTEGMPAAEAGVKAGDIILSVGGKEMVRGDMKPRNFRQGQRSAAWRTGHVVRAESAASAQERQYGDGI